jgi:hypothetical protein
MNESNNVGGIYSWADATKMEGTTPANRLAVGSRSFYAVHGEEDVRATVKCTSAARYRSGSSPFSGGSLIWPTGKSIAIALKQRLFFEVPRPFTLQSRSKSHEINRTNG